MARKCIIFFCITLIFNKSYQKSQTSDPFYNAGVVEFRPSLDLYDNLNGYLEIIKSEKVQSLDILVFPEYTLNSKDEATFVPDPLDNDTAPCDSSLKEYHKFLIELSCAVRNSSIYLVINLTEKEKCSKNPQDKRPCAPDGFNYFNTNVVFNRKGRIISRYRKVHPYGENVNTTLVPEIGWFDTDFGVRFGHFICYDILFHWPTQILVENFQIKNIIFTTMWFSQLPFLTAVQFHQAWSYANNVNFLAAGSSDPLNGTTGSGIYNGRNGILVSTMEQEMGKRTLLTAQVPKEFNSNISHSNKSDTMKPLRVKSNLKLKTDHLQSYHSISIDIYNQSSLSKKLCFPETSFCCQFDLQWQKVLIQNQTKHYHYRLGIFDGLRYEKDIKSNNLKNCGVFSCTGPDILDCGKLLDSIDLDVVFENITITSYFPKSDKLLIMPNSLKHRDLMPLSVEDFEWYEEIIVKENVIKVRYSLIAKTQNLMAFSTYGNYFNSDDNNSSSRATFNATWLLALLLCYVTLI